ncbi:hypothetical protein [Cloacibacterium normanense]|uniref:Uncharacterized protein n=1 Tax=Cloacibacterium normanense TaxID=237258 RepID=A0A1E5UGK1_9FLAO|nr:hypothetical protein [Cloacibacterium normanense]AZI68669.1 hypothetical protein EB819_01775 [Cloacibacterium normanense]OEL12023.1 hypothetical protein BHF72_1480 [Cloacibacterium normanense]SDO41246.1 hypothetical protein SAMN04489756_10668 [Cloacibacterium normanense]
MKADVQYNDFVGTAAADISDFLGTKYGNSLESFGKYFKLDLNRFEVIGLSIYGTENHYISLLCIDKKKTTDEKEHITSLSVDIKDDKEFLSFLFKRLHLVLHSRFDDKYPSLDYDEEANFDDYHEKEEE